jgi:hypothetical protein
MVPPEEIIITLYYSLYYASQNIFYNNRVSQLLQVFIDIFREPRYEELRQFLAPETNIAYPRYKNMAIAHGKAILMVMTNNVSSLASELQKAAINIASTSVAIAPANSVIFYSELVADVLNTLYLNGMSKDQILSLVALLSNGTNIALIRSFLIQKAIMDPSVYSGGARKGYKKITRRRRNINKKNTRSKGKRNRAVTLYMSKKKATTRKALRR